MPLPPLGPAGGSYQPGPLLPETPALRPLSPPLPAPGGPPLAGSPGGTGPRPRPESPSAGRLQGSARPRPDEHINIALEMDTTLCTALWVGRSAMEILQYNHS